MMNIITQITEVMGKFMWDTAKCTYENMRKMIDVYTDPQTPEDKRPDAVVVLKECMNPHMFIVRRVYTLNTNNPTYTEAIMENLKHAAIFGAGALGGCYQGIEKKLRENGKEANSAPTKVCGRSDVPVPSGNGLKEEQIIENFSKEEAGPDVSLYERGDVILPICSKININCEVDIHENNKKFIYVVLDDDRDEGEQIAEFEKLISSKDFSQLKGFSPDKRDYYNEMYFD